MICVFKYRVENLSRFKDELIELSK